MGIYIVFSGMEVIELIPADLISKYAEANGIEDIWELEDKGFGGRVYGNLAQLTNRANENHSHFAARSGTGLTSKIVVAFCCWWLYTYSIENKETKE